MTAASFTFNANCKLRSELFRISRKCFGSNIACLRLAERLFVPITDGAEQLSQLVKPPITIRLPYYQHTSNPFVTPRTNKCKQYYKNKYSETENVDYKYRKCLPMIDTTWWQNLTLVMIRYLIGLNDERMVFKESISGEKMCPLR